MDTPNSNTNNPEMTLVEVLQSLMRHWKVIAASAVVCTLLMAGYLFLSHPTYQSQASIVASSRAGGVYSLANTTILESKLEDYKATAGVNQTTRTVYITVTGPDREGCTETCQMILDEVTESAERIYPGVRFDFPDTIVETQKSLSKSRYLLAGFFLGLFGSIAVILVRSLRKQRAAGKLSSEQV